MQVSAPASLWASVMLPVILAGLWSEIGKDPWGLIYSSNCPFLPSFRFILKNFNLILNVHVASHGIQSVEVLYG